MCTSPILLSNKNRPFAVKSKSGIITVVESSVKKYKDTTGLYSYVPCGKCDECVSLRQNYKTQRFIMESIDSDFYFCTLTYDNAHLPVATVEFSDGQTFTHCVPYVHDIQLFIKSLRNNNVFGKPFKYFVASEYGGKTHRAHYHILFSLPKDNSISPSQKVNDAIALGKKIRSYWCENIGTRKNPIYRPRFRYAERWQGHKLYRNFDFQFVRPKENTHGIETDSCDVFYYASKYVLKVDKHVNKILSCLRAKFFNVISPLSDAELSCKVIGRFTLKVGDKVLIDDDFTHDTFNQYVRYFKPFSLMSKHFGDHSDSVSDYIVRSIRESVNAAGALRSGFSMTLPTSGKLVPLSPYYIRKYATLHDYDLINDASRNASHILESLGESTSVYFTETDSFISLKELSPEDMLKSSRRLGFLEKRVSDINSYDDFYDMFHHLE